MEGTAPEGPVWSQGLIPTLTPPTRLPLYMRQNKMTLTEAGAWDDINVFSIWKELKSPVNFFGSLLGRKGCE